MVDQITTVRNILGECPVWSAREKRLYWMDLIEPALYACSLDSREVRRWPMPEYLGGLALRGTGGLVIGMQHGIVAFDPETGRSEDLAVFGEVGEAVRFNDGKCDSRGRFFVGNMKDPSILDGRLMEDEEKEGAGSIFVLETDRSFHIRETGFTIPNGFTWNRDETILYLADSHENAIYAYDYDAASGTFSNRRLFASTRDEPGVPDGACLDVEGCLWSARNGGSSVVRYRQDGTVASVIPLPVSLPTSVAFGGKNLETLFVTTATQGLSEAKLQSQPLAGTVLALDAGVRGMPVHHFAG